MNWGCVFMAIYGCIIMGWFIMNGCCWRDISGWKGVEEGCALELLDEAAAYMLTAFYALLARILLQMMIPIETATKTTPPIIPPIKSPTLVVELE